jgi:hypothetical protein
VPSCTVQNIGNVKFFFASSISANSSCVFPGGFFPFFFPSFPFGGGGGGVCIAPKDSSGVRRCRPNDLDVSPLT